MGIADGSQGEPVDCSVGTIVWVRRRNGSWWPGRILGSNELSASHLMSPRSGTPVKLLGREDASVDWYNLEKSKRVKAFRCGEFDDCIEKAESSQGVPIKKREKYARREDAILHALELEKLHLEEKQEKLGISADITSEKVPGYLRKQYPSDYSLGKNETRSPNCKSINGKSQPLSKRPDSPFEEHSMSNPLYIQKIKQANKPGWEDDNSEAVPRMRGLQDFGLKIAPSKRKLAASIACESSQKHVLTEIHVNSSKHSMANKRKRPQGGLPEESLVKRRDRRRPLVQVLQSSAKLSEYRTLHTDGDAVSSSYALPTDNLVMEMSRSKFGIGNHVHHPSSLIEDVTCSDLIEEEESDFSGGDFLNPDSEEEGAILSGSRNSERYMGCNSFVFQAQGQSANIDNEELDESGFSGYLSPLPPDDQSTEVSADMGVSKWQLKGKRNVRNLTKRPMELMDGNKCNGSLHEAYYDAKGNPVKTKRMGISSQRPLRQGFHHQSARELNYAYKQDDLAEDFAQTDVGYPLMLTNRMRNADGIMGSDDDFQAMSPSDTERFSKLPLSPNSERCLLSQSSLKGYWEDSDQGFDPLRFYPFGCREADPGNLMESMLVDVDLKVQASYQGERVPLVSLMSRLNGKAIIGHPVQIEVLDDGSTNLLLSESNCREGSTDKNGSSGLPPVWRTGRRTAMQRVPRPRRVEDEDWDPVEKSRHLLKRTYTSRFNHKMSLARKSSHIHRPLMDKLSRKIVKKASLPNQKTRTLSSFAVEQNATGKSSNSEIICKNGNPVSLLKPENTTPITCIPVKLVFSRILEVVGGSPPKPS